MPAITITPSGESVYPHWQWAPRKGNPAQYYGEPYPSDAWVMGKARELFAYRQSRAFPQADATRQWLLDYGVQVECQREALCVKW